MMTTTQPTCRETLPGILVTYQDMWIIWARIHLLKVPLPFIQTWTSLNLRGHTAREQSKDFIEVLHNNKSNYCIYNLDEPKLTQSFLISPELFNRLRQASFGRRSQHYYGDTTIFPSFTSFQCYQRFYSIVLWHSKPGWTQQATSRSISGREAAQR